ncbi:MAG: hypothetical protein OXL38_06060 [Gammaproteobacteria bacterium]|nr:hypothetical protein [Gammaproteobacteria bacterium]
MATNPESSEDRRALSGQLIGISISESDDLARLGLIPAHLERALAEVATMLASAGARIGYGGHLEPDGFTPKLLQSVARLYGSRRVATNAPPCVHYIASAIWHRIDAERLFDHVGSLDGTTEVVLVAAGGLAFGLRVEEDESRPDRASIRLAKRFPRDAKPGRSTLAPLNGSRQLYDTVYTWLSEHADAAILSFPLAGSGSDGESSHDISSASDLGHFLRHYGGHIAPFGISDAQSYSEMRLFMAADEEARVVLGGRTHGYAGHFPGIAEESLYSLLAGRRVVALRGFGGCAEDVAHALVSGELSSRADASDSPVFAALAAGNGAFLDTLSRSGLEEAYLETTTLDSPRRIATGVLKCLKQQRWREAVTDDVECFRDVVLGPRGVDRMVDEVSRFPIDRTDKTIAATSALVSLVPWLGGAASNVVSGYGQTRKFNRVKELLDGLASRLSDFESDVAKEYVRTEDFEDLLQQTLRRVADERNAEVRNLYLRFIHRAIAEPGDEYDGQMDVLRAIEGLRGVHVTVMRALCEEPRPDADRKFAGSPSQTLRERTGLSSEQIKDAVETLNDLRLINLDGLHVTMTGRGSESLQHTVTTLGIQVLDYIAAP